MTTSARFGQIVWAEIADANGFRKTRPAVIVTPDPLISATATLEVVAITSHLPQPLPDDHVLLPWHPRGHPRTGLNCRCAAVCRWVARILPSDIQGVAGRVTGHVLLEILAKVAANAPPSGPPAPGSSSPAGGPP